MNVLITSAGRRTSLLTAFKRAAEKRGGKVFAGDIDSLAPALYFANEGIRLSLINEPGYIDSIKQVTVEHNINIIVPTIDTELPVFSWYRSEFLSLGCQLVISSPELIGITQDKWETVCFFREKGIRTPRTSLLNPKDGYKIKDEYDLPDDVFIKPRNGSASKHTYRLCKKEIFSFADKVPSPIVQEYLPFPEITVDALLDFDGNLIHYVPRRRIRTLGGESIQGVTLADNDLRNWLMRVFTIIGELGGRGPITVQCFLAPDGPILSEINPRFGGGFPLTLAAGGDYPEWILQMVEGKKITQKIGEYKVGLYMSRYYSELILDKLLW